MFKAKIPSLKTKKEWQFSRALFDFSRADFLIFFTRTIFVFTGINFWKFFTCKNQFSTVLSGGFQFFSRALFLFHAQNSKILLNFYGWLFFSRPNKKILYYPFTFDSSAWWSAKINHASSRNCNNLISRWLWLIPNLWCKGAIIVNILCCLFGFFD